MNELTDWVVSAIEAEIECPEEDGRDRTFGPRSGECAQSERVHITSDIHATVEQSDWVIVEPLRQAILSEFAVEAWW